MRFLTNVIKQSYNSFYNSSAFQTKWPDHFERPRGFPDSVEGCLPCGARSASPHPPDGEGRGRLGLPDQWKSPGLDPGSREGFPGFTAPAMGDGPLSPGS